MNIRSKFVRGHFYHLEGDLYGFESGDPCEVILARYVSKWTLRHDSEDGSTKVLKFIGIAGTDDFWLSRKEKNINLMDSFDNLRIKIREVPRDDLPLYISMPFKTLELGQLLKG